MNIHDVNQGIQTSFLAGMTILTDNVFEIIGAVGVVVNLAFVYKSYLDRKAINRIDAENKNLEQELLRKQLDNARGYE